MRQMHCDTMYPQMLIDCAGVHGGYCFALSAETRTGSRLPASSPVTPLSTIASSRHSRRLQCKGGIKPRLLPCKSVKSCSVVLRAA